MRKVNKAKISLINYGKKILPAQGRLQFHEGKQEVVASSDCSDTCIVRNFDSVGAKLVAVAIHIRIFLAIGVENVNTGWPDSSGLLQ